MVFSSIRGLSDCKIVHVLGSNVFYPVVLPKNASFLEEYDKVIIELENYGGSLLSDLDELYKKPDASLAMSITKEEEAYIDSLDSLTVFLGSKEYADYEKGTLSENASMLNDYFSSCGVQVKFVQADTMSDLNERFASGEIDIIPGFSRDYAWAKEHHAYLSFPLLSNVEYLVRKWGNSSMKRIALVKGTYLDSYYAKREDVEIVSCMTIAECLDAIKDGKADYTYVAEWYGNNYASMNRFSSLLFTVVQVPFSTQSCFAVSDKQSPLLVAVINRLIASPPFAPDSGMPVAGMQNLTLKKFICQNPGIFIALLVALIALVVISIILFLFMSYKSRKNEELRKANGVKAEFYANMSHEMRTPLNIIMGLLALDKNEKLPVSVTADMQKMESAASHLLGLVNDILDSSDLDKRKFTLCDVPCVIGEVLGEVEQFMSVPAKEKDITILYTHDDTASVMADPLRIRQLVVNLISNALKFSKGRTVVRVTSLLKDDDDRYTWYLSVADKGYGISGEMQENMFLLFVRGAYDYLPSSGLGLSIVKGIVDAYGGKVEVESQVGKGSTFFVSIPFKKTPRSSEEQVLSEYGVLQGKTVLVAEDNPVNAEVLKRILGKISVSVVLAVNGREALDIFSSATPGTFFCVLMDIRMPVMDGIESAKAIRLSSHPDAMVIPIIAISANASEQDRTLSLEAGMNAHLAKPVIPRMLFDTLAGLIDQSSSVM